MLQSLAEGAAEVLWWGGPGVGQPGVDLRSPPSSTAAADQWVVLATDQGAGNVGGMMMAAVILLLLGLAGVVVWRTEFSSALPFRGSAPSTTGSRSDASVDGSGETATTAGAERTVDAGVEAKSDPEVIVDILEDHEGRMKQANIVNETGWSKSKVSMLLSDMEEDGEISKLRVGRENIISLSGNEPEAAGSPFDDE